MIPKLTLLDDAEIRKIHSAAMEILEKTGIEFQLEKAVALFKRHGFRVDGNVVFFTEEQVMEAVKAAPRTFTMTARNPEKSFTVGDGTPCVAGGNGYVNIIEPGGRRPAVFDDTVNLIKLQQSSDCVHMTSGHGITAADITGDIAFAHAMMLNGFLSDKPLQALGFNAKYADVSLDLARIIFGEAMGRQYVCMGALNPTSPLHWVADVLEAIFAFAEANQPVEIAPAGMLGTTMPVTTAGGVVCATAEVLSGVVLMQLIRPGLPVIPGTTSSSTDMKTMTMAMGAPEGALMAAALNDVIHSYGLPVRTGGGLVDAKALDCQAGVESTLNLFAPMLSGSDMLMHMGMCEGYTSFSYEKFIADEEIFRLCARFFRGIDTADSELAAGHLAEVGRSGQFLSSPYTFQRFRTEFWEPQIFERRGYDAWQAQGGKTAEDKCTSTWQARLAGYAAPEIEPETAAALWAYVHDNFGKIDGLTRETCIAFRR